jgi:DNA primase
MIDIISYLDDKLISYSTSGKNVTKNWCNIQCPFCQDHSNHLGIHLDTGNFSCWKCGSKGVIENLIIEIEQCSFKEAKKIINKYRTDLVFKKEKRINANELILPKEATNTLPLKHREYLISRGFDPDYLQQKYKIMACDILGDYKFRIIIPIYFKNKLVNFTAKSIYDNAKLKIKNCPNEQAVIQRDSLLYNFDNIKDRKCIIVEGFTDVWKMGDGAVATMGTKFTNAQIQLLSSYCDSVWILYDSELKDSQAPIQAEKLAHSLYGLIKKVEILSLKSGDPGDLTFKQVEKIREEIGII